MLWQILLDIAQHLGVDRCTYYGRAFHFDLGDGDWTVAISPDSADRIRIETCHFGEVCSTRWCRVDDATRLAVMVRESWNEASQARPV
jgi:hypothetical protein